jgi:hypothetical protein
MVRFSRFAIRSARESISGDRVMGRVLLVLMGKSQGVILRDRPEDRSVGGLRQGTEGRFLAGAAMRAWPWWASMVQGCGSGKRTWSRVMVSGIQR